MNKAELIKLKKSLQQEIDRRNRINELLSNNLIQEFISLNNLNINELQPNNKWLILEYLIQKNPITESNGILVCTNSYLTECDICYQETNYYTRTVDFDNKFIEYQEFIDIETYEKHRAYVDKYIHEYMSDDSKRKMTPAEYCHSRFGNYLISELMDKYTILNPHNSSKNYNGFRDVQKDFFTTAIEKGQPKAKQLVLSKYQKMK